MSRWTPEHRRVLSTDYANKGAAHCSALTGHSVQGCIEKARLLGIRNVQAWRNGTPYVRKPKPADPTLVIAGPKRGPAYSDGPLVVTAKTKIIICSPMPAPTKTNTYAMF